ncbi:hypothetical protein FHR84_003258 [Actinopolyspora biskrensis]|uniref:Uncharacterized protein n=1 Tax=Actinopolyspora biskrensis TaxID=1470178 RepID=A0A852Z2C1_9ACTN|nr:hypothetical protein [Actinopolyspora biskrensis]
MRQERPRTGFRLAWRGELGADAVPTQRHLEPILEALDEIETALHTQSLPSPSWEWSPISPELLDRVRSGLWDL